MLRLISRPNLPPSRQLLAIALVCLPPTMVLAGLVALGGVGWALYSKFFGGVVRGWTTIMIVVGLGSSAQLLMTGILGEYVGRIYEEVKRRPLYVVDSEINLARPDQTDRSRT